MKKHRKDLKLFSSIGGLHARINFLYTCAVNNVIPNGFKLNWKEETGYSSETLTTKVTSILDSSSMQLLKAVLEASEGQFARLISVIEFKKTNIPQDVWIKGIQIK